MKSFFTLCMICLLGFGLEAQSFADPCMTSPSVGTSFGATANMRGNNSDAISWNGSSWAGTWPIANVTLPPPGGTVGVRGVWMGDGTSWTTGGEGFGMRMVSPMSTGVTYSFSMTRVSHGHSSGGSFAPTLRTNTTGTNSGYTVGTIPAAGSTWMTGLITFTATASQNGHNWLYFHTQSCGCGSGMFIGCPVVLPMELSDFKGWALPAGNHLEWQIRNDIGFTRHLLERSRDGEIFSTVQSLEVLAGRDEFKYEVLDEEALKFAGQSLQYRVRSLNENGESALSPVVEIVRAGEARLSLDIYPNPGVSGTDPFLRIPSGFQGKIHWELMDLQGKSLKSGREELQAGSRDIALPLGDFPSGTYFLTIKGDGIRQTLKYVTR